jgi:hypothetical protein
MRTIIDLPASQLDALDALCRRERISRAEAIRRAVAAHVGRASAAARASAFGLWRDRGLDGLAYERRMRHEWARDARRTPRSRRRSRPAGNA